MDIKPQRLDQYLVTSGLTESRSKAVWLIEQGMVRVNETTITDKSFIPSEGAQVNIVYNRTVYVSQGGYKLEKALKEFELDIQGMYVLDIGASTGGFTDCALKNGASRVTALDIGIGQLHPSLQHDPRVFALEKTDFRTLQKENLKDTAFDLLVADLSFMSAVPILPLFRNWMKPHAKVLLLVKPQFEQNEKRKFKGGIIKNKKVREQTLQHMKEEIKNAGYTLLAETETDADGKTKNVEYLLLFQ